MGKARVMEIRKNYQGCLDVLAEVIVRFDWYVPALVEKTRLLLALGDWEQVLENIARILASDAFNIPALCYHALHTLTRDGNSKVALKHLQVNRRGAGRTL